MGDYIGFGLGSKLLKGAIGTTKEDTRPLDYSSNRNPRCL